VPGLRTEKRGTTARATREGTAVKREWGGGRGPERRAGKRSELTVGQLAQRSGVAVSALHFYEAQGLISARRTSGNQRRYPREMLRRVAFIRASQRVGIPLARIKGALNTLPAGRTPTPRDWARLSAAWRADLDDRIRQLQNLRDKLTGCIGCGCLSINGCQLANPDDVLGNLGPGARNL
jgi:MerR family transcriptional regulator, redox-sensitive transcriptional activator SoxR